MRINKKAMIELEKLKRVNTSENENEESGLKLLAPSDMKLIYQSDNKIELLWEDKKYPKKELIQMIKIIDEEKGEFEYIPVVSPRAYAESLESIPLHISTQGLFFSELDDEIIRKMMDMEKQGNYNKHIMDRIWLPINNEEPKSGDIIYIMNRRVGGWDGTHERPVVELLGAGGHVPCVWNEIENKFQSIDNTKNLQKEIAEEMKIYIGEEKFVLIGGFHNVFSNELVLVYGINVSKECLKKILERTQNNFKENTDGIYIGKFYDVMEAYKKDATYFAGGEKAKKYNFPMNQNIMKRIKKFNCGI